jgi:hypothetical protein
MGENHDPDPGSRSGMNNPDYISESLEKFFDAVPGWKKFGSGMEKFGSCIRDKPLGSTTLWQVETTLANHTGTTDILGRLLIQVCFPYTVCEVFIYLGLPLHTMLRTVAWEWFSNWLVLQNLTFISVFKDKKS